MAITTVYTYPLNGTARDFNIPFEYLARRFVSVTLIGTNRKELSITTDFRFTSKTSIQTTKAWSQADGYELIEIRRNTSVSDRLVDFADGSILRAYELNIAQVQTLHVAEEARNMVADTIGVDGNGDLDARARRIVNLADATEPGHAVTLRQEQEWAQSTLGNRNASESAKVSAEQARDVSISNRNQAGTFKDQAEAAKVASETARDQSVSAAGTIGNNATLAQQARVGAESARDATVAAAQSVQGVNIPSAIGNGLKWLRQKANELGFEYVEAYTKSAIDALLLPLQAFQGRFSMPGEAPMYACRAWVKFNGETTPPTVYASGNVASVVKVGTGTYTITFSTPMPDSHYAVACGWMGTSGESRTLAMVPQSPPSTTSITLSYQQGGLNTRDMDHLSVAVFR